MNASEHRLQILRHDLQLEELAVRMGWGDPAKAEVLTKQIEALASQIQADKIEAWEQTKQAMARLWPQPEPVLQVPPELACLMPMDMDRTFDEMERAIERQLAVERRHRLLIHAPNDPSPA